MNYIFLSGRLVKDPELKQTVYGRYYCKFRIATDRRFKRNGRKASDFFNVAAWGDDAEKIVQNFSKGSQITLSGYMEYYSYTTRDGIYRTDYEVQVDDFDMPEKDDKPGHDAQKPGDDKSDCAFAGNTLFDDDDFTMVDEIELTDEDDLSHWKFTGNDIFDADDLHMVGYYDDLEESNENSEYEANRYKDGCDIDYPF